MTGSCAHKTSSSAHHAPFHASSAPARSGIDISKFVVVIVVVVVAAPAAEVLAVPSAGGA
jgi:hypothetical protein